MRSPTQEAVAEHLVHSRQDGGRDAQALGGLGAEDDERLDPRHGEVRAVAVQPRERRHLAVAPLQLAFESTGLKPGFHFIGGRVETGRFQAVGQLDSTRTAPPRWGPTPR
jgi:hypothetical protein